MKTKTTLLGILTYLLISCSDKETNKLEEVVNFKIRPIEESFAKNNFSYTKNLELNVNISHFNRIEDKIYLEFPILGDEFKYYNVFNISSDETHAILVLISNNSRESISNKKMTHLMDGYIPFNVIEEFNTKKINFQEIDELDVIILNEHIDDFYNNKTQTLIYFRDNLKNYTSLSLKRDPKNGGGGVIVGFP